MSDKTSIAAVDDIRALMDKIPNSNDDGEKLLLMESAQEMAMALIHLIEADRRPLIKNVSEEIRDLGGRVKALESVTKEMTAKTAHLLKKAREKGLID